MNTTCTRPAVFIEWSEQDTIPSYDYHNSAAGVYAEVSPVSSLTWNLPAGYDTNSSLNLSGGTIMAHHSRFYSILFI